MHKSLWIKFNQFFENPKKAKILGAMLATILITTNILTLTFGFSQQRARSQYEDHLSFKFTNDISGISTNTGLNSYLLKKIIEEGKANHIQLEKLKDNFELIYLWGRDSIELATKYKNKVNPPEQSSPYPVTMALNFSHFYLKDMIDNIEEKEEETVIIEGETQEKFKLMRDINGAWVKAIENNMTGINIPPPNEKFYAEFNGGKVGFETIPQSDEFFDTYIDDMVTNEDWYQFIQEWQNVSLEYQDSFDSLFR